MTPSEGGECRIRRGVEGEKPGWGGAASLKWVTWRGVQRAPSASERRIIPRFSIRAEGVNQGGATPKARASSVVRVR